MYTFFLNHSSLVLARRAGQFTRKADAGVTQLTDGITAGGLSPCGTCLSRATQHRSTETETRGPLTYDQAHLAQGVLVATGHHGTHGVVDQRHHVQVELLWAERQEGRGE